MVIYIYIAICSTGNTNRDFKKLNAERNYFPAWTGISLYSSLDPENFRWFELRLQEEYLLFHVKLILVKWKLQLSELNSNTYWYIFILFGMSIKTKIHQEGKVVSMYVFKNIKLNLVKQFYSCSWLSFANHWLLGFYLPFKTNFTY